MLKLGDAVVLCSIVGQVLPVICDDHCEIKMEQLDDISVDSLSRVICAFLNASQTPTNSQEHAHGINHCIMHQSQCHIFTILDLTCVSASSCVI